MAGSGTSAAKINAFVARGLTTGWDKAGMEPPEPKLDHLMAIALGAHYAKSGRPPMVP
jgi:hypothetical protein